MKTIVIVGGGFTGAVTAIHLARETSFPLEISVVEPREDVSCGLAYSASDPDHRINAPAVTQVLLPDKPRALVDWLERTGECESDPEMEASGSVLYPRRSTFGAFVNAEFVAHAASNNSGSRIRHVRCRAVELEQAGVRSKDHLDTGHRIGSDDRLCEGFRMPAGALIECAALTPASEADLAQRWANVAEGQQS